MPGVTTAYQTGVHGSRPSNGAGCIFYSCTTHALVYRDDGTTWTTWATLGTAGAYVSGGTDVAIADGGTGASTKAAAFDALSPMTTQDDIVIGGASGTGTRLGKGSDSQVLTVDPSTHHLVWATPSSGFADPMTTRGDIIARNALNVTARLAIGSSGKVLSSDGTDISWQTPSAGGVAQGTSFPGSPATNLHYCRTDLNNAEFFYDGTRWRSVQMYEMLLTSPLTPNTTSPQILGAAALPGHTQAIWWVDHHVGTTGGTNDGSNYWTFALHNQQDAGGADATVATLSLVSLGSGWLGVAAAIGASSAAPVMAYVSMAKTGSPSGAYWTYRARYQLIQT